jgi:hypothetical protein
MTARCTKIALALAWLASCDRGHHEATPPPPQAQPAHQGQPIAKPCTLAANPAVVPAHRLVAIGDLHGDLEAARAAFRAAGAIDASDKWIGGDLVVVQTGDVLDRGDGEVAILDLIDKLARDAKAAGGAVVPLLGNHELMNAAGDFRYVTPGGQRDFDGDRAHELAPGGVWGKRLAAHDVVAIVGDTVFSHAGVLGPWATKVPETNLAARCWLDGQGPAPAVADAQDGPLWTRTLASDHVDCAALHAALDALGAKRMVIAHTVQPHINAACDGALWRIDVGMTKMFGGPIEVLEVAPTPRVLAGSR